MFSVQNYQEIMKFVKRPNQQYLIYHQRSVDFINENAWDVLAHIFLNCFFLFYVFNCYLNEINIFEKIKIKLNVFLSPLTYNKQSNFVQFP